MSIINKMHQGLQANAESSPILSSMPAKKQKKKVLLFALISLLLASSIGLSYLIYDKENTLKNNSNLVQVPQKPIPKERIVVIEQPEVVDVVEVTKVIEPSVIKSEPLDKALPQVSQIVENQPLTEQKPLKTSAPSATKPANTEPEKKLTALVVEKQDVVSKKPVNVEPSKKASENKKSIPVAKKTAHLEIKKSVLSPAELANIHLKSADKAMLKGDAQLAAQEKNKALNVKPDLHNVRESLALYYYGIGEQEQAKSLLKKGAIAFPEYSDFNLMLSRIALKNGEQQKAYLYLQQSPPDVAGNIDYHVSYAILAQKFKDYQRAEKLFQGLLSQRPNNGRWRMSLAIAQDKTNKEKLAVENYKKALLQIDLSSNAKKYINQRLTYLANQ